MSAKDISVRGVAGNYFRRMEQSTGGLWIPQVSMYFISDQETETYPWLGMPPSMRQWKGGRQAKTLRDNKILVTNEKYESTIEVKLRDLRRDKTGQLQTRIADHVARSDAHWAKLASTQIIAGLTETTYDGSTYFATDHEEGDSGAQSNKLSVDISALTAAVHGTVTAPSPEEARQVVNKAIAAIQGFVDDTGEPTNEGTGTYLVMTGNSLWDAFNSGIDGLNDAASTAVQRRRAVITDVVQNPRLNAWTDAIVVFRTDSEMKPILRQSETGPTLKILGAGSDHEFNHDGWQFGLDADRAVTFGMWDRACYVQMA